MAQPEGWQLSGQGPESYELHLVPALFAAFAASLVTQATLQLGERLLDAACGTGIVARMSESRKKRAAEIQDVIRQVLPPRLSGVGARAFAVSSRATTSAAR